MYKQMQNYEKFNGEINTTQKYRRKNLTGKIA